MKAVQIDAFGGPEVLSYRDVPDDDPGPDDVVIAVEVIGVNHLDIDVREGVSGLPVELPHTLGTEAAGTVAEVGTAVTGFAPGDPVTTFAFRSCGQCRACRDDRPNLCGAIGTLGGHYPGTYAERLVVPAQHVVRRPEALSPEQTVASYKLATAWEALVDTGRLRAGETLAVTGAGGGVGSAAVILARHLDATVIGIASSDARCARIDEIGADHTINYRTQDLTQTLLDLTGGDGVDVVFDVAGGANLTAALQGTARGGRALVVGAHGGEVVPVDMVDLFRRHIAILGCGRYTKANLDTVLARRVAGLPQPPVHAVLPLADAAEAHRIMESRDFFGRLLLTTSVA